LQYRREGSKCTDRSHHRFEHRAPSVLNWHCPAGILTYLPVPAGKELGNPRVGLFTMLSAESHTN
jgi:hypothetical protein